MKISSRRYASASSTKNWLTKRESGLHESQRHRQTGERMCGSLPGAWGGNPCRNFRGQSHRPYFRAPEKAYKECEKISYSKIYQSKPVLDIELSGYKSWQLWWRFHRSCRQPIAFLLQTALAQGKQPVWYRERESGGAHHGGNWLYQRHDRHLCARHLSEDQRNQPAYCIREM